MTPWGIAGIWFAIFALNFFRWIDRKDINELERRFDALDLTVKSGGAKTARSGHES